ncbi:MAG: hypothetical protein HKL81_06720 [Acidimicrobiaceae bacterium]|nr:hypothetical protein [Acidimicrobiaceae bacterium]
MNPTGVTGDLYPSVMTKRLHFGLLTMAIALTACGAASANAGTASTTSTTVFATTTTASTLTIAQAGQAYLVAAAKVNAALGTFANAASTWGSQTTGAQIEVVATPAISALKTFQASLLSARWPASAVTDIHTLYSAVGAFIGDLQAIASVTIFSEGTWQVTYTRDMNSLQSAVGLVRFDLGLPSAS